MADRRKGRKAAKDEEPSDELNKETEAIAKFVRFNCPTKVGMFEGNEVHYFSGRKAIDTLVESKKYGEKAKEPKFTTRAQAEAFMTSLLHGRLLFKAKVLVAKKKDDPRRLKADKTEKVGESPRVKRVKQQTENEDTAEDSSVDTKKEESKKEEEKKKKKIKLVFHDHQVYNDDSDVYVWVYDPTPLHKKIIGLLIVLGVILACLFPLWPDWLRLGVYYLSITGISLFGILLGVALLRTILFGIIYVTTMGRHNLWILPNLTEDCGFFESFQPLYTYEYCAPGGSSDADSKKKDKKKKKDDDEEPLIEDVKETPKSAKKDKKQSEKKSSPPPDPEPHQQDETDPEEKYSKSGSDNEEDNSSAEEDEVSENGTQEESNNGSTGDSSEPADVVKLDDEAPNKKEETVEEPQTTPAPTGNKSRRRRVRRADDEDFVMVQGNDGN